MSLLTTEHIKQFQEEGFCVIEDVLNPEQVLQARTDFHNELLKYDVNVENILNGVDEPDNLVRKKSKFNDMFYAKFKMDLQINEQMYLTWKELYDNVDVGTPLGPYTDIIPYVDRVCCRLPDHILNETGIKLHIDMRPGSPNEAFMGPNGIINVKKWRPIQSSLALTNHYGGESGGLKLVSGFHKEFKEFFKDKVNEERGGEFFRMHDKSYEAILHRCLPVTVPAGSLVLWDTRLPHATCQKLSGFDTREVLFMAYIPNVPLNIAYRDGQRDGIINKIAPPSYCGGSKIDVLRDYEIDELSEFQKQMLNIK